MRILSAAIAIAIGLITLLGFFFERGLLFEVRLLLVQWAIILAGVAVFVGILNLTSVHWEKLRRRQKGSLYSLALLLALWGSLLVGMAFGPQHSAMRLMLDALIIPVESALMALLTVTLVYASIRLLRRRADVMSVVFLLSAVLTLLMAVPLPLGYIPFVSDVIQPMLTHIPATAGARGILIGVALGTLTTGLRILFGADRPYGGK